MGKEPIRSNDRWTGIYHFLIHTSPCLQMILACASKVTSPRYVLSDIFPCRIPMGRVFGIFTLQEKPIKINHENVGKYTVRPMDP